MKPTFPCLIALSILGAAASAHGQANFTFSGGGGTPLTLTLTTPVTYTVTAASTGNAPIFVFDTLGGGFTGTRGLTGTIFFTIDGGANNALSTLAAGTAAGAVTADDATVFGTFSSLVIGDTVLLKAGSLTTTTNFGPPAPTTGAYSTFLAQSNGTRLSNAGIAAVPEPSTWAMALGGLGLLLAGQRFRCPARRA